VGEREPARACVRLVSQTAAWLYRCVRLNPGIYMPVSAMFELNCALRPALRSSINKTNFRQIRPRLFEYDELQAGMTCKRNENSKLSDSDSDSDSDFVSPDSDSDSDSTLFNVSLPGTGDDTESCTHCGTEPQVVPEGNAPPQSFSPPDPLAGSPGPLQKVTAVMPVQTRDFKKWDR
jgi:hypothetical protein